MKPESAARLLDALQDAFEKMGTDNFRWGIAQVIELTEKQLRLLRTARTRDGLKAQLLREPEPTKDALAAQVESIRLLPFQLRRIFPEATKEALKNWPHDPGGRPRALTEQEARTVCIEIGKLISEGVPLKVAQGRLALKMSRKKSKAISPRTIQRAWRSREKLFDRTHQDVR